ncbi:MAG: SsrA-binding protein [Pseudomonadota bacterium]|jgi:SsrA-binding protein
MAAKKEPGRKLVAENRKARFEYHIGEVYEAGIQLTGTEVKSLRKGQANIAESYASVESGGVMLINAYIPEYQGAGKFFQHEPRRPRRLLLHKSEMNKLAIAIDRQGMTMVPLELYFNERGRAKLKLALAQGKKLHDKRETEKKRDWNRQKSRILRDRG